MLGEILIQQYQPRLVILGTSFLDYTEGREFQIDERFKQNDWLEYQTGKFTLSGWLTEHSYAWRTITVLSYSAPFGMHYNESPTRSPQMGRRNCQEVVLLFPQKRSIQTCRWRRVL